LTRGRDLTWYLATALRPVLMLADAIDRFGRGELSVRAALRGPTELREISSRFNAMAERGSPSCRASPTTSGIR
jgi:nitrate/nitrite-specific signal transduction histidine kinase